VRSSHQKVYQLTEEDITTNSAIGLLSSLLRDESVRISSNMPSLPVLSALGRLWLCQALQRVSAVRSTRGRKFTHQRDLAIVQWASV
jgi:hypothetical protein